MAIIDGEHDEMQTALVSISETLFCQNGVSEYTKQPADAPQNATLVCDLTKWQLVKFHIENSMLSTSFGLGSSFNFINVSKVAIQFTNVTFFNNSNGGSIFTILGRHSEAYLLANSCSYAHNNNGSLKLVMKVNISYVTLHRLTIVGSKGTFMNYLVRINQGSGILIVTNCLFGSILNISFCNIQDNIGGKSIVYVGDTSLVTPITSLVSSNFTNNIGSAFYISGCNIQFRGHSSFINNSAERGAAVYMDHGSQITVKEYSAIEFIGNTVSQQGVAVFIELSFGCPQSGIVFTDLMNTSTIMFINNSAKIAGNSIYVNNPESCSGISNSFLYEFNYSQPPDIVGLPIATSPHRIILCSTMCNENGSICHIQNRNMLGQSVGVNAAVCDYYGNVSEAVQFDIECINCSDKFRLFNNEILVHSGLFFVTLLAVDTDSDIVDITNVKLRLSSVLSDEYTQLTATVLVELSSCQSGYVFDPNLHQCVCYEQSKDIIKCQQDYAEIKYGYWFGDAGLPMRTVSLCPIHYCEYSTHAETSNGYYKLPEELNDQCSSRRIGRACGECKSGYTLAYDSPDCINTDKCSTGMTILVVALTILYWIIVVALVFALMQHKVSLGYAYGMIYFYSIIDILLGSNLYISDGVFQLVTILSSFAKLTPQFLGKLAFLKD